MTPPSRRGLRFRPLALLAAFAAASACEIRDGNEAESADNADEATLNLPAVPLPEPPMARPALLAAVARAASAAAMGAETPQDMGRLDGRQFELRIRFGCRGPTADLRDAVFGWSFDQEKRTLRVRATPTISNDSEIVAPVAGETVEAVEGFWIPRPWILEPACPAAAAVRPAPPQPEREGSASGGDSEEPVQDIQEMEAPPPAYPKIGIAQFFSETDSRTRRRQMRPYEVVKTLRADQQASPGGYNLVLSGRLRALPGKGVIHCVPSGADQPPDCIVSATFDRVWIERPDNQEVLAEWGSG